MQPQGSPGHRLQAGRSAALIHSPQQDAELIGHRGVRLAIDLSQRVAQLLDGALQGQGDKTLFQLAEAFALDAHRGVPLAVPPLPVAHGVAQEVERLAAEVADLLRLRREERMLAMRRHEDEETAVTQVLHARLAGPLAAGVFIASP